MRKVFVIYFVLSERMFRCLGKETRTGENL